MFAEEPTSTGSMNLEDTEGFLKGHIYKEEILKSRREKYRTEHNREERIKVMRGSFRLYFDQ